MAVKTKPKTLFLELLDKRSSGFFLDNGTMDTPHAEELNTTLSTWIPATGFRAKVIKDSNSGEEHLEYEEIRYIENQKNIVKAEQEKIGLKPNPKRDKIHFIRGFATIVDEGSDRGKFEYLRDVFYNAKADNRSETAEAIYTVIEIDKQAEIIADDDEHLERALALSNSLKTKTNSKENPYTYNEEKIDALATLFNLSGAESYATKAYSLARFAKNSPKKFLQIAENFEQQYVSEVTKAIQLGVIVWDRNIAYMVDELGEKNVIAEVGKGNLGKNIQIDKLADFFKTTEGNSKLTELRLRVSAAQDKALR